MQGAWKYAEAGHWGQGLVNWNADGSLEPFSAVPRRWTMPSSGVHSPPWMVPSSYHSSALAGGWKEEIIGIY